MIDVSGQITINDENYDAVKNIFTVHHDILNMKAAPFSLTKQNTDGTYDEFSPARVEFLSNSTVIYFGSMELTSTDVICYQFSVGTE